MQWFNTDPAKRWPYWQTAGHVSNSQFRKPAPCSYRDKPQLTVEHIFGSMYLEAGQKKKSILVEDIIIKSDRKYQGQMWKVKYQMPANEFMQ